MKPALIALLLAQGYACAADAPPTIPVTPSRMELVQLGPNEYRLQYRQDAAQSSAPTRESDPQIQIVNGNGVRGMGERVRLQLAHHGIDGAKVVNQRSYKQRITIIEYLPGEEHRALAMQTALQGRALLLQARSLPGQLTMRLVLGRDHTQRNT